MNVEYLIQLLENKMMVLTNTRTQGFVLGDLAAINAVDNEMTGVENTLAKLRLLVSVSQAATVANSSISQIFDAGLLVVKNASAMPADPTAVLKLYDISSYASDPLHEEKISDILSTMGYMDTAAAIDVYIDKEVVGSPINGAMIIASTTQYSVDTRLAMAIMELDSRFGTVGVALETLNPGNVGNTGAKTRSYPTWEEGVAAVAKWLNDHRVVAETVKEEPAPPPKPDIAPPVMPAEDIIAVPVAAEEIVPEPAEIEISPGKIEKIKNNIQRIRNVSN